MPDYPHRTFSEAHHGTPANAPLPAQRAYIAATQARDANARKRKRKGPIMAGITIGVLLCIAGAVAAYLLVFSFELTVNGRVHRVAATTTLGDLVERELAHPAPGDLLGIDGSILEEGGGQPFAASVNGKPHSDPQLPLAKGDQVVMEDGPDVTEGSVETVEELPFEAMPPSGSGPLHVYAHGAAGSQKVVTGEVSGIRLVEVIEEPIAQTYTLGHADTGGEKVVALTFDDGPWPTTTAEILDILDAHDAKATFFTIGSQIRGERADVVKRAWDSGHQICTHSFDHASGSGKGVNLEYMTADEQIAEIQQGYDAITAVTGAEASRVIRAPGGNYSGEIVNTLAPLVDAEIGWSIDTQDWRKPGADAIADALKNARLGSVILMHDGGGDRSQTVEALRIALPYLQEQGYRFVTIDELLEYPLR